MRYFLFIISIILLVTAKSFADKTHSLQLNNGLQFSGGELIIDTSGQFRSYFIRPNWTNSLEVVSTWKGFDHSHKIGKSIGNIQILESFVFNNNLILLALQSSNLILLELDSNLNQLNNINIDTFDEIPEQSTFQIIKNNKISFYVKVNTKLFFANKYSSIFTIEKVSENVDGFVLIHNNENFLNARIEKFSDFNLLHLSDKADSIKVSIRVSSGDNLKLEQVGNYLISKSSLVGSNSTLLEIISLKKPRVMLSNYFECEPEMIAFKEISTDKFLISFLTISEHNVKANICEYSGTNQLENFIYKELPSVIYEPISLYEAQNKFIGLFRNFILAYDENLNIKILEQNPIGKKYRSVPTILVFKNYLIIKSKLYSEKWDFKDNYLWLLFLVFEYIAVYLVPIIFLTIAYYFYRKFRKQKQLLNELINLPSSGIMIILNRNSEITKLNQQARDLLGIDQNIPLQKPIKEYLTLDSTHALYDFLEESLSINQNLTKKIVLVKNNSNYEFVFSASPIWSLSGNLKGYLINGYDITEQLERKRLSNWAQLAHDMQTNLLTIRLNAEQMSCEKDTENYSRIKKILFQVNTLQKRVRDIVTVGRSSKLELVHTNSIGILEEVAGEFDKAVFPEIEIIIQGYDIDIYCDRPKLIRAIRNAVENSIKAIPEQKGKIELSYWNENQYHCFKIKDNGIGLDEHLKKKILTPYFTTSKDGSGFGLGTMIIQQVVELHRGKLQINSETDKGTEFILKIPRNLLLKEK